jgi:hypothetical protein
MRWNSEPSVSSPCPAPSLLDVSSSQPHLLSTLSSAAASASATCSTSAPAAISSAHDDHSAWHLQSDSPDSNASSVVASPLPNSAGGRTWLVNRDSLELASQRMHPPSSSSSMHALHLPPIDSISITDHLEGVYSPRNSSWSPAPRAPAVSSPSGGLLDRALTHAQPFNTLPFRPGGSLSPPPRSDGAKMPMSGFDSGAVAVARMKLQDSLALSLNSPLRDQQQLCTASTPSPAHLRRFASSTELQGVDESSTERQGGDESLRLQAWQGSQDRAGVSRDGAADADCSDEGSAGSRLGQGQVLRLSSGSEFWERSDETLRQSLREHGEGNGSFGSTSRASFSPSSLNRSQPGRVEVTFFG